NRPATTVIYTLSLHDALPICGIERTLLIDPRGAQPPAAPEWNHHFLPPFGTCRKQTVHHRRHHEFRGGSARGRGHRYRRGIAGIDRKSTRLNSSHSQISYAVF